MTACWWSRRASGRWTTAPTTRSARWMSPKHSPTAPITSSSGGRSGRQPIRARRPRRSSAPSPRSSLHKRLEQAPELRVNRLERPVEEHLLAARHAGGGGVLPLELHDFVRLLL